jgi:hypothetical protein
LQLLDLALEVLFELIALCGIRGRLDFLINTFKSLNPLGDLLEGLIDLLLCLSGGHRDPAVGMDWAGSRSTMRLK